MATKRDYYELLGVSQDASPEDIRKAFKREAAKHHPDRNQNDPVAEQKFKEINEAYQVLSDDERRVIYDQFGFEGLEGGGADGFGSVNEVFSTMQDVFADAFNSTFGSKIPSGRRGEARRGPSPRRGQDLRIEYTLTLRESIFGCTKTLPLRSAVMCSECDGSGARRGTQPETCPSCRGTGQTSQARGFVMFASACAHCRGSGRILAHPCGTCAGHGAVETERHVEVAFPPGVAQGQNVRVHGYGLPGMRGGVPGDLLVTVAVRPDVRFERVADDLVVQVHMLFTNAILGGDIQVPILDASGDNVSVMLQIPPGTQHGSTIRLPGHGAHRFHQGGRGALVVQVHVDVPAQMSERARALVAELNAELLSGMSDANGAPATAPPSPAPPPAPTVPSDAMKQILDGLPVRRGDELG